MTGSVAGHAAPVRGRRHRVIAAAEQPGTHNARFGIGEHVSPITHWPVIAHGAHRWDAGASCRHHRRRTGQHMLRVDEIDFFLSDHIDEMPAEPRVQPLVPNVVPQKWNRRRERRKTGDGKTVVIGRDRIALRVRAHDNDIVPPRAQPSRELIRAPAASARDGRKRVSRNQDAHARRRRASCIALSSWRQWLVQLKSETARARAAVPNGCRTDGLASRSSASASASGSAAS